jgi:hypothetical protein
MCCNVNDQFQRSVRACPVKKLPVVVRFRATVLPITNVSPPYTGGTTPIAHDDVSQERNKMGGASLMAESPWPSSRVVFGQFFC